MRFFLVFTIVALFSLSLEWYWMSVLFGLAAIGNLVPDKKKNKKKSSEPTVLSPTTHRPNYSSAKRKKLKQAVQLKKTDLPKAIELLREAYADGEALFMEEFLRLPNYLRMNKQYDEAYKECRILAHRGNPAEPEEIGSIYWYHHQNDILKLQARICIDEGKYISALYCNVERYYNELKCEEKKSKHERKSFRDDALKRFEFIRKNDEYISREVLCKTLKHLNKESLSSEAISLVMQWSEAWPKDPQVLGSKLERLLID